MVVARYGDYEWTKDFFSFVGRGDTRGFRWSFGWIFFLFKGQDRMIPVSGQWSTGLLLLLLALKYDLMQIFGEPIACL